MMTKKPRGCPLLKGDNDLSQCRRPVTRYVFDNFCNVPNFESCHSYAEKMGKLKPPFQWLQHKAVERGGRLGVDEGKR